MKPRPPLESVEYERGVAWLRLSGWTVYRLSQTRASRQTPGVPDCYAMHEGLGLALWWEVKRQKLGRMSPAQAEFRHLAKQCGLTHLTGPAEVVVEYLRTLGLVEDTRFGTTVRLRGAA